MPEARKLAEGLMDVMSALLGADLAPVPVLRWPHDRHRDRGASPRYRPAAIRIDTS
jgi:hypothetical protein